MVGLGWVAVALDLARIYAHNQGAWNPVKSRHKAVRHFRLSSSQAQ